jgi:Cu(I)-responsive transcriptional regulator
MNIGQAAAATGLPAKTIRYYEEIGLVTPHRGDNGYRVFRDTDVHKLSFLARARALGFGIESCRDLLALWEDRTRTSASVRQIAQQHLAEIDARIAALSGMRDTLSDLITSCAGDHRPDCPILRDLETIPSGQIPQQG